MITFKQFKGGIFIHIIGRFLDPGQVGGLVDSLKNSGIQRRDMIISAMDEEKFQSMRNDVKDNQTSAVIKSDQDDPGQLEAFVESVNELSDLHEDAGIVVYVNAARHKAQEVKSVMEQSGAVEIKIHES
ncbi:hypothetical protein CLHUN_11640 [Ruminiclostridium hungatei]|uniref:Heat induced stress protein YflT n=1 Tax=Ruminiclostridium hungatei TaxID=48256 RepID=A0A1V4SM17_RUMHU|nr:hypothetical protein [Ruminiclostridium hungatei]OPX44932.1 hypothetical protein CLHUN_11640 [Ruminiclostridium hungatei]